MNVAVVIPAPTLTDGGVARAALLSDNVIVAAPDFETVTVQVLAPPLVSVEGAHESAVTTAAAFKVNEAVFADPFNDAVIVAG